MTRIVIVGAGGHGQVVADILLASAAAGNACRPIGYVDARPSAPDVTLCGLNVLGTIEDLPSIKHDAIVVAIGDNRRRQEIFDALLARGERPVSAVHPTAVIATGAVIEPGCMISAMAVVGTGSHIGANVILNTSATVDHHNTIGAHVHIAPGAHLGGEVTVETGALIGLGASIVPRCTVGAWAVIGAGAVVISDVPGGRTAKGMPARWAAE